MIDLIVEKKNINKGVTIVYCENKKKTLLFKRTLQIMFTTTTTKTCFVIILLNIYPSLIG